MSSEVHGAGILHLHRVRNVRVGRCWGGVHDIGGRVWRVMGGILTSTSHHTVVITATVAASSCNNTEKQVDI